VHGQQTVLSASDKQSIIEDYKAGRGLLSLRFKYHIDARRIRAILKQDHEARELLVTRSRPIRYLTEQTKANILFRKIHLKERKTDIQRAEGVSSKGVNTTLRNNQDTIEILEKNAKEIAVQMSNKLLENAPDYADGLDLMIRAMIEKKKLKHSTMTQISSGIETFRKLFLDPGKGPEDKSGNEQAHSQLVEVFKEAVQSKEEALEEDNQNETHETEQQTEGNS
jgi:hypothetical protein